MKFKTYTVGEMSKMFGLSVQTLRYYDKIGLFQPEYREENSYRNYKFEQFYGLAAICHMRQLGYPLKTIAEIMDSRNVKTSLEEMKNRLNYIDREIEHLTSTRLVLQRKSDFIKDELSRGDDWEPFIQEFKTRYYLPIGTEDILYKDKSFYLNPTIVFYRNNERRFGVYLGTEKEPKPPAGKVQEIPEGTYLCALHRGGYTQIWQHVLALREEYRRLELENWSVHFNIIDQFVEKNQEHYLTKIQIPLKAGFNSLHFPLDLTPHYKG